MDSGVGLGVEHPAAQRLAQACLLHLPDVDAGDEEPLPLLKLRPWKQA